MIEYIHLKNFQKHENKRIDLDSNITFLNGENNAGKSCFLRALQWVAMNKGNSKQFRRTFESSGTIYTSDETCVEIGVDGHVVQRLVSASRNEYYLDGVKYTGFGRGVPTEIQKLFNMSDLNASNQFSPLFLVGDTGSSVAEEISKVIHLEEMGSLSEQVNQDIRKLVSNVETVQTDLQEHVGQYESISVQLPILESLYLDIKEMEDVYQSESHTLTQVCALYKQIMGMVDLSDMDDLIREVSTFTCTIDNIVESQLADATSIIKNIRPEVDVSLIESYSITELESPIENDVIQQISVYNSYLSQNKNLEYIGIELDKVNEQLAQFKICPTCGAEIGDGNV